MNHLFNSNNKQKNLEYLKNKTLSSEVLISEGWVSRFPKKGFKRRIGQQITRWSCVPTSMEVINCLMRGDKGTKQEVLKSIPRGMWQQEAGETRYFMPFDKKTALLTMKQLGVQFTKIFSGDEIKAERILIPQPYSEYGWLIFFSRFSMPDKKPKGEHNHACVLLYEKDGKIGIKIPAYSLKYKRIKSSLVLTYKNWQEIMKRKPVNVILVTPLKKNEQPKWSNKLKVWGGK